MIPKIINYCWFGRNPKPEVVLHCIESWKKYCPDYQIVEWNEENFDFSNCKYAVDAYKAKKWAFVSDYARIKILLEHGGLYFDTDVEIVKNLDDLLKEEVFIGFELGLDKEYGVNTGSMMGAVVGARFLQEQEKAYHSYSFGEMMPNGRAKTCVDYTTELLCKHGLKRDNRVQLVMGVRIFPSDYFSPRDMLTGKINLTSNSRSIHRYDGTWASPSEQYGYHLKWDCIDKYGDVLGKICYGIKYSIYIIRHDGIGSLAQKMNNKLKR